MSTTARERARQVIEESVLPGDVVAGIIGASQLESIPSNELLLSSIFYEFAREKPHLFEDFDFFPGGTYPFTDVLQEQLNHFETEHFLGKPNPTYRQHIVKSEDSNVGEWINKWVFQKLERHGLLADVRELGEKLRLRVSAFEARQRQKAAEQVSSPE